LDLLSCCLRSFSLPPSTLICTLSLHDALPICTPLATWMGQLASWRWTYAMVSVVSLVTVLLLALYLPANGKAPRTRVMDELRAFNRLPVWQGLLIGAIGFAGMFSVFSYLAPTMVEVTGVAPAWIPVGVAGFGLGGLIG